jgi:hypothetical protein
MLSRLPRSCKFCRVKFSEEERAKGLRLHPDCIGPYAESAASRLERKRVAKAKQLKAQDARETREKKKELMTASEAKKLAQRAFNAYIRARDAHLPCVSCGATNPPMTSGGQWDAGHFLSRGAYPELSFHEDNCHKQCKSCNGGGGRFKHKERTVTAKYEEELLRRIGPERLAALRAPHPPLHLDADGYLAIRDTYQGKERKELEAKHVDGI